MIRSDLGAAISELKLPEGISPPTHFKTNTFTYPFQELVNTYGMARYKEVNPGLFAIGFFPFLFGVMFGDIAHGSALLMFSSYLCIKYEQIKYNEDLKALLPFRYMLLLCGLFATFGGFIYNDFASLPLNIFGSCYVEAGHGIKDFLMISR